MDVVEMESVPEGGGPCAGTVAPTPKPHTNSIEPRNAQDRRIIRVSFAGLPMGGSMRCSTALASIIDTLAGDMILDVHFVNPAPVYLGVNHV